jgi:hypothetical protein
MVHFILNLRIWRVLIYYPGRRICWIILVSVTMLVQLTFTCALALHSALAYTSAISEISSRTCSRSGSSRRRSSIGLTGARSRQEGAHFSPGAPGRVLQEILFFNGPVGHWKWLLSMSALSVLLFLAATGCSTGLRLLRRGGMTTAIDHANV